MRARRADPLLLLGAFATLVVGAIHLQQYADFISDVPTIGELFILNAFGAGILVALMATGLAPLAAVAGIGLSAGALVSVLISMTDGGLFDYQEPTFRAAVTFSMIVEAAAVLALGAYLVRRRARSR